jgi:hypothetical protein
MDARTHVEAGGGKVEAGVDAGMARDSGPVLTSPWQFVKASATSGNSAESTVTSGVPVAVGDLVIFGCDLATTSTLMSIPAPTGGILEPFQQVGAVAANGCMAIAAWGIVKTVPTGGGFLTMNGPPPPNTSWEDCAMDIFSGGSPVPHLLDGGMSLNPAVRSGVLADASTIVNCGDVDTAPNGVAFSVAYVSGGASFVQPASAPFIQTEDPASNPSGYASPTDGTRINVEIADNIYAYTCMTFSLAP